MEVIVKIFKVLHNSPLRVCLALASKRLARIAKKNKLIELSRYVVPYPPLKLLSRDWNSNEFKLCRMCWRFRPLLAAYWNDVLRTPRWEIAPYFPLPWFDDFIDFRKRIPSHFYDDNEQQDLDQDFDDDQDDNLLDDLDSERDGDQDDHQDDDQAHPQDDPKDDDRDYRLREDSFALYFPTWLARDVVKGSQH